MIRQPVPLLLMLLVGTGCATVAEPPTLTPDAELNSFVFAVERSLQDHDWQNLLARADPTHYRIQVVEGGMAEPQYVAELLGLHRVDNDIGAGEAIGWRELERIEAVSLESVSGSGERHQVTGSVTLDDGAVLRLDAQIIQVQGRYVLTGGVG